MVSHVSSSQVHRSPGFITSNLIGKAADGSMIKEFEASHGTVADMWEAHQVPLLLPPPREPENPLPCVLLRAAQLALLLLPPPRRR